MEPVIYQGCNAVPSASTKRSDVVQQSNDSTLCAPTAKRQRFSLPSSIDLKGGLNRGTFSLDHYCASSDSPGGSSRINNIRVVSASSMHATHDNCNSRNDEDEISSMANFDSSKSYIKKDLTDEPTLADNDLLANKIVNGSWASSVASLECVCIAIQRLRSTIGSDAQSQLRIADQCYYLAAWTKINTPCYSGNDTRPTSTTASLTLNQVALAIISYGGITVILNAMRAHPNSVEIQENGSMVLGNVLALLYRRKTGNVVSYGRFLSETAKQMGSSILNQLIQTMQNHATNVEIHCAAIAALQHYYLSVLVCQQNDATLESQSTVLRSAHEMLLPSKIRQILRTTISLAEQFIMNCR